MLDSTPSPSRKSAGSTIASDPRGLHVIRYRVRARLIGVPGRWLDAQPEVVCVGGPQPGNVTCLRAPCESHVDSSADFASCRCSVELKWLCSEWSGDTDVKAYEVGRRHDGPWLQIGKVPDVSHKQQYCFIDPELVPGDYSYRVRAVGACGYGPWSEVSVAKECMLASMRKYLNVTLAKEGDKLHLKGDVRGFEDCFEVEIDYPTKRRIPFQESDCGDLIVSLGHIQRTGQLGSPTATLHIKNQLRYEDKIKL